MASAIPSTDVVDDDEMDEEEGAVSEDEEGESTLVLSQIEFPNVNDMYYVQAMENAFRTMSQYAEALGTDGKRFLKHLFAHYVLGSEVTPLPKKRRVEETTLRQMSHDSDLSDITDEEDRNKKQPEEISDISDDESTSLSGDQAHAASDSQLYAVTSSKSQREKSV